MVMIISQSLESKQWHSLQAGNREKVSPFYFYYFYFLTPSYIYIYIHTYMKCMCMYLISTEIYKHGRPGGSIRKRSFMWVIWHQHIYIHTHIYTDHRGWTRRNEKKNHNEWIRWWINVSFKTTNFLRARTHTYIYICSDAHRMSKSEYIYIYIKSW